MVRQTPIVHVLLALPSVLGVWSMALVPWLLFEYYLLPLLILCLSATAVKGAAQLMGDMVTGRVAETKGQSLSIPFDERDGAGKFNYIIDVLAWRAQSSPENVLFSMVDSKVRLPCVYVYIHS